MLKCNEDSFSESDEEEIILLERSLVIQSTIEVDHLICCICHHIIWQPIACGERNGCQNAFCGNCIKVWLQKCSLSQTGDSLCPHCKRIFVPSCIPPIMKSVLFSLILKCPNNSNGCPLSFPYEQIANHLTQCGYKVRRCRGCYEQVIVKNYEQHINQCPKYLIECNYCSHTMPKVNYLQSHIKISNDNMCQERSEQCFQNQITSMGQSAHDLQLTLDQLNHRCDHLENLTKSLVLGEPLSLNIQYYTTFQQHFSFPNPTLIKPSFNEAKEKFDFLHFYIANPIHTNSFVSIKWTIHINKMMGNILIGFCSNMSINSLDYIVNKFGELKRKDMNESKYKIVRKNDFSFTQGDTIRCRFSSLLKLIKIQNITKKQVLQLGASDIRQFDQGSKIFVFISMDTINDSISFL